MIRLAAALAVLAAAAPGQGDAVDVHALARSYRTATDDDVRDELASVLLREGERGATALFHTLRLEQPARARALADGGHKLAQRFAKAARAQVARRLATGGQARVDALRDEILARSRGDELTKETIVGEIDPRFAELEALRTVGREQVLEREPELAAELVRLRAAADTLLAFAEHRARAVAILEAAGAAGRQLAARDPAPADDPARAIAVLEGELDELAAAATPLPARDAKVLSRNEDPELAVDGEERAAVRATNRLRTMLGLPALQLDVLLCAAAREHSADMERLGFFSHTSPVEGRETLRNRAAAQRTTAVAENIARGQATGADAVRGWWHSPGHHKNLLLDAARVGVGRHERQWTQMFGR